MQPNALLLRQNFIIRKKWVLQGLNDLVGDADDIEIAIVVKQNGNQ
jgi:hypothetical protein